MLGQKLPWLMKKRYRIGQTQKNKKHLPFGRFVSSSATNIRIWVIKMLLLPRVDCGSTVCEMREKRMTVIHATQRDATRRDATQAARANCCVLINVGFGTRTCRRFCHMQRPTNVCPVGQRGMCVCVSVAARVCVTGA